MADIWISLLGSNATGDGSPQLPYRDFSFAYSIHKGDSRYVFSNAGGTPTSTFEEVNPLEIIAAENVVLFTQTPGTVFLKAPAWTVRNSSAKVQNLMVRPRLATGAGPASLFTLSDAEFTLAACEIFDINTAAALSAVRSKLYFYSTIMTGLIDTTTMVAAHSNCRLHIEGLTLAGVFDRGIDATSLLEWTGNRLLVHGQFKNAARLSFGGGDNLLCKFEDVAIDGSATIYSGTPAEGLSILGAENRAEENFVRRLLLVKLMTGLYAEGSLLLADKATISTCRTGVRAVQDSNLLLRNSVLDHNMIGMSAEMNATITYDYSNLFENTNDYPLPFIPLEAPEEFRMFLEYDYELGYQNILAGSERVAPRGASPGTKYTRDIDYVINYGTNFEAATLKRIPGGAIPDGQWISVTYDRPSGITISGYVVPGARIRRVDPGYLDYDNGDYRLSDYSALIDGGIFTGFSFMGTNPDMGYHERTRALTPAEAALTLNLKSKNDDVLLPPDIANTILIQEQNLLAYNPALDVSEGSALRDLVVKPVAQLQDPIRLQLNFLLGQQSIDNYATMTEEDLDLLAANLFISRRPGNYATGPVRLRFAGIPSSVVVPAGTQFVTGDALAFFTMREQIFLADEIIFNRSGEYYYVDVQVQAENIGSAYAVAPETIRTVLNYTNVYLVDVSNPYAMSNGVDRETNEQLYARLRTALSVRTMVNPRAVDAVMRENFDGLTHLTLIGAGDPEMRRDIVPEIRRYAGDRHIYGMMDLYVSFPTLTEVSQDYDLDDHARCYINKYNTANMPVLYIRKAELLDDENMPIRDLDRSEYELVCEDENFRFSYEERLVLRLADEVSYAQMRVRLTWETAPLISSLQAFVNADENRVACTDLLVKHYVPKILHMHIDYKTDLAADISEEIVEAVRQFIITSEPGQVLSLSRLAIPVLNSGATSYATPLTVSVETWMQTGHTTIHVADDEVSLSRVEHVIPGVITAERMV